MNACLAPALLLLVMTACSPLAARPGATPTVPTAPTAVARCHYQVDGALPDPVCTPGATDPRVTQDNIDQTICRSGYSASVRPSSTYTNRLKIEQMRAYGAQGAASDYEEDHLVSLELGGAPMDPANLWPERGASPNEKDRIENELHRMVCDHQMTLAEAQRRERTDWRHALE